MLTTALVLGVLAAATPERTHDIKPEDYFSISYVGGVSPAPDGRHVAFEESRWQDGLPGRNKDLWLVEVASARTRRLTFDPANDHDARWSPDGEWIYFQSGRKQADKKAPYDGKTQVWRIRNDGTDLHPITFVEGGVERFELTRDGKQLFFTTKVEHLDEDPWKKLRKKHKKLTYGRGIRSLSALWRLDLRSWRTEKLVDEPTRYIAEIAVSPSADRVALLTVPTRRLIDNEGWSWLEVHDVKSKTATRIPDDAWRKQAPSPYGWLSSVTWADDGRKVGVRIDFDGYPGEMFAVHLEGTKSLGVMRLPRKDEITLSGGLAWRPGTSDLCVRAIARARDGIYCVKDIRPGRHGESVALTKREHGNVGSWRFFGDGKRLALGLSTNTHPADVFVQASRPGAKPKRLTKQNPQIATWKLPLIKTVRWKSKDGTEVEGVLELPPGYDGKSKLPFMLEIHGGPTSASREHLRFWIYGRTLLAARGWALLTPNYRGSTGYGDKFLTDLIGRKNDVDVEDLLSGVDAMVERGIADPERMAVMGWSNGGYLTNCLITRTDRFKAASSGAGVIETTMQWMIEDTPGHVVNFSQGLPWTQGEAMHGTSPLYDLDKVKTPTLIHVGERDPRVPAEHSRALFRALDQYLGVPTQLIEYPGAHHSVWLRKHRQAKMDWDLAWFDYWVLGKGKVKAEKEASDPTSAPSPL